MTIPRVSAAMALLAAALAAAAPATARAADLLALSRDNYEQAAPKGKEARAFIGDHVLRNDKIALAVADPRLMSGRSSSRWSIPNVSGAIVDLARLDSPAPGGGDLLRAYYPGPFRFKPDAPNFANEFTSELDAHKLPGREPVHGQRVTLNMPPYELASGKLLEELAKLPPNVRGSAKPFVDVAYTLEDGWDHVLVETTFTNPTDKPFTLEQANLLTILRADDARESVLDFGNQLACVYDTAWPFAYGIVAEGHTFSAGKSLSGGLRLAQLLPDKSALTLAPGKSLTLKRRIIPGRDIFQVRAIAARLLKQPARAVTLSIDAPDGPVADALVTATIGKGDAATVIGSARAGADGALELCLPAEPVELSIGTPRDALGAAKRTIQLDAKQDKAKLTLPDKAARVVLAVVDEKGAPLPAKIEFRPLGVDAKLILGPDTGERAVRNLRYTENGKCDQVLPPGRYRVVVSAGPERDFSSRDVAVKPGEPVTLDVALPRRIDSTGLVSIDTHTHSAASGSQDQFYVYPYTPCPVTDGASFASPLGRVLNLLCENIEFAPTSEHNFVSSFAPQIAQLGAESKIASVPGVGMTAGRRHTVNHQIAFPVRAIPGAQDGGAIPRPEHVMQITWLSQWYDSAEKIILVAQPCDSPLSITPEVDALDLRQLEPVIEGEPIKNVDGRVLDWIAKLTLGYRLPAVVSSNAYSNFHGAGAARTFVPSASDEPAKIDALEVARAIKRGRAVMTTGPLLRVAVVGADGKDADAPAIKDSLRAEDGKVTLHLSVQASNWAVIDRVQVLVNGQRSDALNFTRAKNAAMFADGVTQFDQKIPLTLPGDAHLLVVASGTGPSLHGKPVEKVTHVALSNPIFVDVGKKGYEPASPLEDKVRPEIEFSRPVLARLDAPPGHVRVTLRNTADVPSEDSITIQTYPEGAVKLLTPATQKYSVPANGETFVEWELVFTPEFLKQTFPVRSTYNNAGTFGVRVERSDKPPGRRGAARWMEVENSIHLLPTIDDLHSVPELLKDETVFLVRGRSDQEVAKLRMGVTGSFMAMHLDVTDAALTRRDVIFEGSCVEVFGAMANRDFLDSNVYGGYRPINQLFLLPAAGGSPDTVKKQAKDKIADAPEVKIATKPTPRGYEMSALIPLASLGVDADFISRNIYFGGQNVPAAVLGLEPRVGRFRIEVRVTASANKGGETQRGTLFRAGAPHVDHHDYGQVRVEAPVTARVEQVAPLSFAPGGVGKMKMTLTNTSAKPAAGTTSLRVDPENAATIRGDAARSFKLAPGASESFDFEMTANDTPISAIDLVVTRGPDGCVMTTPALTAPLCDRPMPRLPAIASPEAAPAALASAREYKILSSGVPIVSLRLAAAGDDLALVADVVDTKVTQDATPWKGSCFEVFAEGTGRKITQFFLQPGMGDAPARAMLAGTTPPAPAPGVRVRTVPTATGYQLQALIPFKSLNTDATKPALEFQITATDEKGKTRRGTLFGSPRAYQDSQRYGRFLAK